LATYTLLDESLSSAAVGDWVEFVAETDVTDGLKLDAQGNLYLTSLERYAQFHLLPDFTGERTRERRRTSSSACSSRIDLDPRASVRRGRSSDAAQTRCESVSGDGAGQLAWRGTEKVDAGL
jgi:hypothetical protein